MVQLVPVLEKVGRAMEADQALHDAQVNSHPEHTPDVILDVSTILVWRDQQNKAIQVLEEVLDAWSSNERASDDGAGLARAVAALRLGNLLAERNDLAKAVEAWQTALRANFPAVTPEAALKLADAFVADYEARGGRQPAEVEELYRIAIDFDHPTASPEAALRLADFYLKEEQPQLAVREYEQLLPIPDEVGECARIGLAKAREKVGSSQGTQGVLRRIAHAGSTTGRAIAKPIAKRLPREAALIVGAGTGGKYLLRDLGRARDDVVGWVDDDQKGVLVGGLPLLGTIDELPRILPEYRIKTIYIAIPTMSGERRRRVVEAAMSADGVTVKNLPSMFELLRGRNLARQLRAVRIEETMGEQAMRIDRQAGDVVRGASVMITGAGSTIGGELSRQVAHARARYVSLVDVSTMALRRVLGELERDRDFKHAIAVLASCDHIDTMHRALEVHRPEVVFHVAGHSYGPIVEDNALEAMRSDIIGTWDFARLCGSANVKRFVLVSSEDAAESRGVFAASKALAEKAVAAAANEFPNTIFVSVRMGNVYRSTGSVVEVLEHQIDTGGPISLMSDDASRRFMRVELATQLLLRTAQMAETGDLYALRGEEEILIRDLAEWMIQLRGYAVHEIGIEVTKPRRFEKSLGSPYNDRERPATTNIPGVQKIKPPPVQVEGIEDILRQIKDLIAKGNQVGLHELIAGPVQDLLEAKPPSRREVGPHRLTT
jgi:FlaA1/EpsC-like NDP-sugar epimerase